MNIRISKSFTHTLKHSNQSGMTLVELLVVLAIFIIVSGITIFDYGRFRSTVSLQNLADDIGLSIRRAQNYAIGVHSSESSEFRNGYGVHFSTGSPIASDVRAGSNKSFILFSDLQTDGNTPGNKVYDHTPSNISCTTSTLSQNNECADILTITSNDIISSICPGDGSVNCGPNKYVDITFLRPNPDATICIGDIGSSSCQVVSKVDITIQNNESHDQKILTITSVGQISIK